MRPGWFAAIISIREPEFTGFYLHFLSDDKGANDDANQ
jgi:hypothetical protein